MYNGENEEGADEGYDLAGVNPHRMKGKVGLEQWRYLLEQEREREGGRKKRPLVSISSQPEETLWDTSAEEFFGFRPVYVEFMVLSKKKLVDCWSIGSLSGYSAFGLVYLWRWVDVLIYFPSWFSFHSVCLSFAHRTPDWSTYRMVTSCVLNTVFKLYVCVWL